ncbi:MAG TPA: winged helix-turn-helix transcriptional regulator [Solirubrobacterales bacterium]|nr:winged helix-turn-helix transcriptional regulator [Solirubrobacterales bacterium]
MATRSADIDRDAGPRGARTLLLLTDRSHVQILGALCVRPTRSAELADAIGVPDGAPPRTQLRHLVALGAIAKRRLNGFPGLLEYELTEAGRELLEVDETLDRWLAEAPGGPLQAGTDAACSAIKALADGWSAGVVSGLAAGRLTLAELAAENPALSYPSLEHRLAAMRLAGLVELCRAGGSDRRNTVGGWLRGAAASLLAACDWEQRLAAPERPTPSALPDLEAIELLASGR